MHYSLEKSNFAQLYQLYMKKYIAMVLLSAGVLSSCGEYNKVLKSTDYEYKYEAAKSYFAKGQNSRAATILEELIPILKGTANGEEALYMLGMTYYNQGDFMTASHYFNTYYTTYPRGTYTELARFIAERLCILILRNHVWTRVAHTRLFRNCRCLWNISRQVSERILPRT
mgnify:CR=1 FL=1